MNTISDKYTAVLFLDMDGVMILNRRNNPLIQQRKEELLPSARSEALAEIIAGGEHLPKKQLDYLHEIASKVSSVAHFHIVISSHWRTYCNLEELKTQVFKKHAFSQYILDVTPSVSLEAINDPQREDRGLNIDKWVQANAEKLGIQAVAILDDYDFGIKPKFPNQFVYVEDILGRKETDRVITLLSTPQFSLKKLDEERSYYETEGVKEDKETRRTRY